MQDKGTQAAGGAPNSTEPSGTKRILFVDDEPNVLAGLRNALRSQRRQWDMVFALGPIEGLAKVGQQPYDVVVSDMRMPHMDGATFLAEIKRLQPNAVRIILTGQTELESVIKSAFVAHLFLTKPCDPELLKKVVDRACSLSALLNSEELRAAAGRVEMLPAVPKTYVALNQALVKPTCSVNEVAEIIERDVGLCAKILQLVNSAFFGLPRKISSLHEAVTYIGTLTIKNLAMALELFASSSQSCGLTLDQIANLQRHSLLAGQIARRIGPCDKGKAEEAFLAGVLHEVGKLIPVDVPDRSEGRPSPDRSLLGAYLLGLWGFPHPITEAVAYHRDPLLIPHTHFELVDAVYIAHHLADELMNVSSGDTMDLAYLESIQVGEVELEQMRSKASQLVGSG